MASSVTFLYKSQTSKVTTTRGYFCWNILYPVLFFAASSIWYEKTFYYKARLWRKEWGWKKSKDWCINKISRNIPAKGAKQDRRIFMTSSPIPSLSKIFSSNVVVIINIQSMSKTGVNMSSKKRGLKGCKWCWNMWWLNLWNCFGT